MAFRHLKRHELDAARLENFIRYLVLCAQSWTLISYKDAQKSTGLSYEDIGNYLGNIGDFCMKQKKWGPLPALVLSANGKPSEGFAQWRNTTDRKDYGSLEANWAHDLADCLDSFYRKDGEHYLTELGEKVRDFIASNT